MANLYRIKHLAEKKQMPINMLAERVGLSEQQLHLIVRKNSTKIETLEKIAKALKVPISVFFEEEEARQVQIGGKDNTQSGRDTNNYINIKEHDELIRLRQDIQSLRAQLAHKDEMIAELRNSASKQDARIASLEKMNEYLMGVNK